MDLATYIATQGLTYAEFGGKIGTRHARTVERYAKRQRKPRRPVRDLIAQVTGGMVSEPDWHCASRVVLCGTCELSVDRPEVRCCTRTDCPLSIKEAA